jgi:hypothetical protein
MREVGLEALVRELSLDSRSDGLEEDDDNNDGGRGGGDNGLAHRSEVL